MKGQNYIFLTRLLCTSKDYQSQYWEFFIASMTFLVPQISHILHYRLAFTLTYDFCNPPEQCHVKIIMICYSTGWTKKFDVGFSTNIFLIVQVLIFYTYALHQSSDFLF